MSEPLSKAAGQLLALLPRNGKPVGSISLKRQLELSEEKFVAARTELLQKGLAAPGKGRGGSLRRLENIPGSAHAFPIETLAAPHSSLGRLELKKRKENQQDPNQELENLAWQLVCHLSPTLISTGRDPVIQLHAKFQPDVVAIFSEFMLICDSKNTTHGTYVSDWFDTVELFQDELSALARAKGLKRVIYLCVLKDSSSLDEKVTSRAKKLRIRLLDAERVQYFLALQREAGIGIRHLFWAAVAPQVVNLEEEGVPALSVRLGKKHEAFIFSANAHSLLPRALISHRELHDPEAGVSGYQRMLKRSRLVALAKHIDKNKAFPSPIVVALDKNTRFDPGKENEGTARSRLGRLWLPGKPGTIQIIDGQHRLFGYSLVQEDEEHIVHVIGYRNDESLDPASMFVDINSKQKPVSAGLLWELYPDIFTEKDQDYYRSMISQAVERAIKDIKHRVTHITSRTKGPITFQALCSEIPKCGLLAKKTGLVRGEAEGYGPQTKKLEQWLRVFFEALLSLEAQFRKVFETLLFRNVGIIPALRLFGRILHYEQATGNLRILKDHAEMRQQVGAYFRVICERYDQKTVAELDQIRSRSSSQGGFKRMVEEFADVIDKHHKPGFAGSKPSDRLSVLLEDVISSMDEINRKGVNLGTTPSAVFKEFDNSELRRIARKKELDIDTFEKLVIKLHHEIHEGSGDTGPNNRLARVLEVPEVLSVPILRKLHSLRIYFSHKGALIDAPRRKAAVEALQELLGSPVLKDPRELTTQEFNLAACNLLSGITDEVLSPAKVKITNP